MIGDSLVLSAMPNILLIWRLVTGMSVLCQSTFQFVFLNCSLRADKDGEKK